jgi:hypothetical protein
MLRARRIAKNFFMCFPPFFYYNQSLRFNYPLEWQLALDFGAQSGSGDGEVQIPVRGEFPAPGDGLYRLILTDVHAGVLAKHCVSNILKLSYITHEISI